MRRANTKLTPEHPREIRKVVEAHAKRGFSDGDFGLPYQFSRALDPDPDHEIAKRDPIFLLEVPAELERA